MTMNEENRFRESLRQNHLIILVVLMLPVGGMIASIPLIIWRRPESIMPAIPIIFALIVQYMLLVRWIDNKMKETLNPKEEDLGSSPES